MRIPVPASWKAMVCASETTAALEAEYGVLPALERRPATDAVAMMLPEAVGFSGDVLFMAGAACLAARKTLDAHVSLHVCHRGWDKPERVHPHGVHELVGIHISKRRHGPDNPSVGEEDIKPAVPLHRVVDDGLHGLVVTGIELPRVNVYGRPRGVDLLLVRLQVGVVKIAKVHGLGAVLGELVRRGPADAQDGVCP
jgi:hypothetical protein